MKKLLIIGFCAFLFVTAKAQSDNDWANFGRFESANAQVKLLPQQSRNVVFMGNSITEQWYVQDSSFFTNNKYINRGISGQTTSQMLIRFRKDVVDLQPKLVVILAGTNDIARNTGYISLNNILGNLVSMVEIAKTHHIKTVLCSVLPAFDYPWRKGMNLKPNEEIPKLNAMIKAYCEKNDVLYLDYFTKMADQRNGLPGNLSKDGVHPTLEGDKIMENLVQNAILKSLKHRK